MAVGTSERLVYFVSGMWCSTCAKNIRESVSRIDGVASADVNYASKLLVVRPASGAREGDAVVDEAVRRRVGRIGFGIKRQSEGWILNFHEKLERESSRRIPWTQVCVVWFLAMWSSMFAFAGYLGGGLTEGEAYGLALASSAFGLPAILVGLVPYASSGLRALVFSRLLTLDFFIFCGGCAAVGVSVFSLLAGRPVTYADSGSMILAILLLTKKVENAVVASATSDILYQLHPKTKSVEVFRKGEWTPAEVAQVRKNDLVRIARDETVPFDGVLECDGARINNHLMTGEADPVPAKKGDHVFAGAISQEPLELRVSAPQGERKIDSWAEDALISGGGRSRWERTVSKIESALVVVAFTGALGIALARFAAGEGARGVIESFFVGVLVFCPCLFASIIPLTRQISRLALLKAGLLLQSDDALWDLADVVNFYFDKTGTLEAVESAFVPFEGGDRAVVPYLNALAEKSRHVAVRALRVSGEARPLADLAEFPGSGLIAKAEDGAEIMIGRPSFFRQKGMTLPGFDSAFSLVSLNGKFVGQLLRKSVYDSRSRHFLRKLLDLVPEARIRILSGDPAPRAGEGFASLDRRISYEGNLSPEEKARAVEGKSAFVGDGLNDTLALARARVSFRLGHRVQGFAPVDFHLQTPNLNLVLAAIQYSRKYRAVLLQTAAAAFLYNVSALTLAAFGKFSPLGAVLSMLASFSVMLASVSRLHRIQGAPR